MNKSELMGLLLDNLTVRVPASELFEMVDHFWDSGDPGNLEMSADELMNMKRLECGYLFVESVSEEGIHTPCSVSVEDGRLFFEDGHHRMALAIDLGLDIPITTSMEQLVPAGRKFYYAES